MSKKRYEELDILRGLAITGVILIHVTTDLVENIPLALFLNQISRFAVPGFLFLSGIGLTLANKLNQGYLNFLIDRFTPYFGQYLIWSLIYYLFSSETFNGIEFIINFLLGTNYYHLYYVPIIIVFYLLYPLLLKIGRSLSGLFVTFLITLTNYLISIFYNVEILSVNQNIFNWLFYFVLGIWFAQNCSQKIDFLKQNRKLITGLFISAILVSFSTSFYMIDTSTVDIDLATTSMRPSIILFSISVFLFIMSINWRIQTIKKSIIYLSKYSYGMYLSHAFILALFRTRYLRFVSNSFSAYIYILIGFIVGFSLSILYSKMWTILSDHISKKIRTRK